MTLIPRKPAPALALILALTMALTACTASWLSDFEKYVTLAAPAIIDIIEIIAIAQGVQANAGTMAKINADAAALEKLASDYSAASASAQPGIVPQIQAAFNTLQQDASTIFQVAQVNDPAKQALIQSLIVLVQNTFTQIASMIPQAKTGKVMAKQLLPADQFVSRYNALVSAGTHGSDAKFDKEVSNKKLHIHSKVVRLATFGKLN